MHSDGLFIPTTKQDNQVGYDCYLRNPYIKGCNCALFSWNAPDNAQLPYLETYNALFAL